ncbi:uncharacterized protein VP01_11917g1, partial [Puccinia sorghi]
PEQFPTNSSKVAFAVSFMTDYTATWSQPYLMKVFNVEEVAFNEFLDKFKSSFFDNRQNCAEDFNSHACTVGWAETPLMSLYQHRVKGNIQLAMVMSNIQFTSLWKMQVMALKAGQTIEGIRNGQTAPIPPTSSSAPTTDPNAIDLLAFQHGHNQLPDTKQASQVQLNLCFHCGQAGHVSCRCSNGNRKL